MSQQFMSQSSAYEVFDDDNEFNFQYENMLCVDSFLQSIPEHVPHSTAYVEFADAAKYVSHVQAEYSPGEDIVFQSMPHYEPQSTVFQESQRVENYNSNVEVENLLDTNTFSQWNGDSFLENLVGKDPIDHSNQEQEFCLVGDGFVDLQEPFDDSPNFQEGSLIVDGSTMSPTLTTLTWDRNNMVVNQSVHHSIQDNQISLIANRLVDLPSPFDLSMQNKEISLLGSGCMELEHQSQILSDINDFLMLDPCCDQDHLMGDSSLVEAEEGLMYWPRNYPLKCDSNGSIIIQDDLAGGNQVGLTDWQAQLMNDHEISFIGNDPMNLQNSGPFSPDPNELLIPDLYCHDQNHEARGFGDLISGATISTASVMNDRAREALNYNGVPNFVREQSPSAHAIMNQIVVGKGNPDLMSYLEISSYFHLPIKMAALAMNVGETKLKARCRVLGIGRWPYRGLKSIDSLILYKQEKMEGLADVTSGNEIRLFMDQKILMEKLPGTKLTKNMLKIRQATYKERFIEKRRREANVNKVQ